MCIVLLHIRTAYCNFMFSVQMKRKKSFFLNFFHLCSINIYMHLRSYVDIIAVQLVFVRITVGMVTPNQPQIKNNRIISNRKLNK